jgi:hypothetical protein
MPVVVGPLDLCLSCDGNTGCEVDSETEPPQVRLSRGRRDIAELMGQSGDETRLAEQQEQDEIVRGSRLGPFLPCIRSLLVA